ncbi:hypothetical protein WJX81_002398 [Elliptochloris bilobata]|uniref:mannan endo-1,4-beta-mannosidase n=1 Tax=Elliptochloris bilobata TaxID=381761 RepID=A0AAW1RUN7_9CHLO
MTGSQLIRTLMDAALAAGLNTLRMWSHGVTSTFSSQSSPGVFSEPMFLGLDYALEQARLRNIKVIIAILDNWQSTGGVDEYVAWTGANLTHGDFYINNQTLKWYMDYAKHLITRVNTINGRKYVEDDTIFAWDLLNEARCQKCPNGTIAAWMAHMAKYVKGLDSNHLVTTGTEGFYSTSAARLPQNPGIGGSAWAAAEGQDFLADHASPDIDFATFHAWIDNWKDVDEAFLRSWIRAHVEDAAKLHKPVILEEFGKWLNASVNATMAERNHYFNIVFNESNRLIAAGSNLKGIGFWEWLAPGQLGPVSEGGGQGLYGIYTTDATSGLIATQASFLARQGGKAAASCNASAHAAPAAAAQCEHTRVGGLPGTGMEGPACEVDVNECVRGTSNCAANSTCTNTNGSFTCACWAGYTGDGRTCMESAAVGELEAQYSTQGTHGPLFCDVAYPQSAPGVIYDPTGATALSAVISGKQLGVGNPGPVDTLTQCLIACESAPGCSAVTYLPTMRNCFLKGCPSRFTVSCPRPPPPPSAPAPDSAAAVADPATDPAPAPAPAVPDQAPKQTRGLLQTAACSMDAAACAPAEAAYANYYSRLRYRYECTFLGNNQVPSTTALDRPGRDRPGAAARLRSGPASQLAAALLAVAAAVAPCGAARASDSVPLYFGNGCFWGRQKDYVDAEQKALGRAPEQVTAVVGYAGGKKLGKDGKVCYYYGPPDSVYERLGHAEVVQVQLDKNAAQEELERFADVYFSQFQRTPFGMLRLDPQDMGPGYRNVVGMPGGVRSPLFAVLQARNVHNMELVEGHGNEFVGGRAREGDAINRVYVLDSDELPFNQAEVYHQFHDGIGHPFPAEYKRDQKAAALRAGHHPALLELLRRLPIFAQKQGCEYAHQFNERCQKDQEYLLQAVLALSEIIDLEDDETLNLLRNYPGVILVPPGVVASRTLQLKLALPAVDLRWVLRRAPWLVTEEDGAERARAALRKLKALMPALPVEERLMEGSLWNNFASLLRDRPAPKSERRDSSAP